MKTVFSRVFTLEVDGRATLAFEASATRQAMQICKESWLLDDLTFLRSNGVPLGTVGSRLSVRPATPEEITVYEQAAEPAEPSVTWCWPIWSNSTVGRLRGDEV
jgi:hypothetical protein